jgi:hypothetical protein
LAVQAILKELKATAANTENDLINDYEEDQRNLYVLTKVNIRFYLILMNVIEN